eukprot:5188790-Pyramimonas_sp.AAC.1
MGRLCPERPRRAQEGPRPPGEGTTTGQESSNRAFRRSKKAPSRRAVNLRRSGWTADSPSGLQDAPRGLP